MTDAHTDHHRSLTRDSSGRLAGTPRGATNGLACTTGNVDGPDESPRCESMILIALGARGIGGMGGAREIAPSLSTVRMEMITPAVSPALAVRRKSPLSATCSFRHHALPAGSELNRTFPYNGHVQKTVSSSRAAWQRSHGAFHVFSSDKIHRHPY